MSDLAGELKNAIMAPGNTVKVCGILSHGMLEPAIEAAFRWFGELKQCELGTEDIFLFDRADGGRVPSYIVLHARETLKRNVNVFEFDTVAGNFVRRDEAWFDIYAFPEGVQVTGEYPHQRMVL